MRIQSWDSWYKLCRAVSLMTSEIKDWIRERRNREPWLSVTITQSLSCHQSSWGRWWVISLCQLFFLLITWPIGVVSSYPTRFLPFSSCCSRHCPLAPAMDMPCFLLFGQLLRKSQVANLGNYCMMPWEPVGTITTVLHQWWSSFLLWFSVGFRHKTKVDHVLNAQKHWLESKVNSKKVGLQTRVFVEL